VAHLNHQLRGASSLADERLVTQTARHLNVPCVVSRADVRTFASQRALSIEMAARQIRHDFLARTAVQRRIPCIALAHHLDDHIELFFLRLFRGSGSQGLAGMKWKSPSPSNRSITLVRPLLDCSKKGLRDYAAQQKVPFREDSTNTSSDIQRNRIRNELLPLLKREYQPALNDCLSRVIDILSAESEFLTATAESWLRATYGAEPPYKSTIGAKNLRRQELVSAHGSPLTSVARFESLPVALQRRCVQLQLMELGIAPDYDLIEHLRRNPDKPVEVSPEPSKWSANNLERASVGDPVGGGISQRAFLRLVRDGGKVLLFDAVDTGPFLTGFTELDLQQAGQRNWHKVRLTWQIRDQRGLKLLKKSPGTESFDADKVGPVAVIRHWRPGDRFQPIGFKELAKLQDLFVNQKVPRDVRRHLLVAATANGDLFWVEGLRISERFKLTENTNRRLQWRWQRL
jgi:tRNA(Ile)-lysidine synthase